MFSSAIANMALRELSRSCTRFTSTNKQLALILLVLDHIFVTCEWEILFLLVHGLRKPALVLTISCCSYPLGRNIFVVALLFFFFEKSWFKIPEFLSIFRHKWLAILANKGH